MLRESKFRKYSRIFFSMFLMLSCFAGCGTCFYWLSDIAFEKPVYKAYYNDDDRFMNYRHNTYYSDYEEKTDTIENEEENDL